jgi:hypothetical protein
VCVYVCVCVDGVNSGYNDSDSAAVHRCCSGTQAASRNVSQRRVDGGV